MTKRHFQAFADMILDLREKLPEVYREQFAEEMANLLSGENPRFDRTRFLEACGLVESTPE